MILPLALAAQTLVVGVLTDPVSLDPHRATDLVSAAVMANVCEPLVRYRADGSRPQPALATTWASTDGRVWTFTLREGVHFHDGTPLDADAVVANLEALRRTRGFPGRAQRVGPLVVEVILQRPNAALLATLSQPFFSIQSPRELQGGSQRPVGTGPFRLEHVEPGEVVLTAFPGYWNGPPRLRQVVFRRYRDQDALVRGLKAAEVDVTSSLGREQLLLLHEDGQVLLDTQTGLNIALLSVNNERPPLGDARLRQAVARAIDRPGLVREVLGGHGAPARNPLPPSIWGYAERTPEIGLDRVLARRLMARAGFADGFATSLTFCEAPRPYLPAPRALAERIARDLLEVGIHVRLRPVASWAEYLERVTRGDYDLALLGWQADTTDPNDFLSVLLESTSIGTTNRSRYHSPAMDTLLERGRRGHGPEERKASYRGAQELFQKEMPWVPLYHVSVFTAYRREVQGLVVGTTGLLRYDKVWKKG